MRCENECPECFGQNDQKAIACARCEFRDACRVCTEMPDSKIERVSGCVSYDAYAYAEEIADTDTPQELAMGRELDERDKKSPALFTAEDMKRVLGFLLRVDDYAYSILSAVVTDQHQTASALAREFGVSRQAIHRKIRDACAKNPDLRQMFRAHLFRCKQIMRDRSCGNPSWSPKGRADKNHTQQELKL